jgi:hypothetical protein
LSGAAATAIRVSRSAPQGRTAADAPATWPADAGPAPDQWR